MAAALALASGCTPASRRMDRVLDVAVQPLESTFRLAGVTPVKLPAQSPNLNATAERFVRSVKSECLPKLLLFGEDALRRALPYYVAHYHTERNHQGKDNQILFPQSQPQSEGLVACKQRLGGVLKFYYREAA